MVPRRPWVAAGKKERSKQKTRLRERKDEFLAELRRLGMDKIIIEILLQRHEARIEAGEYQEALRGLKIILMVDPENEKAKSLRDQAQEKLADAVLRSIRRRKRL
jgi:uncharacterized protein HemY